MDKQFYLTERIRHDNAKRIRACRNGQIRSIVRLSQLIKTTNDEVDKSNSELHLLDEPRLLVMLKVLRDYSDSPVQDLNRYIDYFNREEVDLKPPILNLMDCLILDNRCKISTLYRHLDYYRNSPSHMKMFMDYCEDFLKN